MSTSRFLFTNGIPVPRSDTPPVSTFLETHPGAYTTTRTHNNTSCLLFWDRHLRRLSSSFEILLNSKPELLFGCTSPNLRFSRHSNEINWESMLSCRVNDSLNKALRAALDDRKNGEELAVTTLVGGNYEKLGAIKNVNEETIGNVLDVFVHIGMYVPSVFGTEQSAARLAVVGPGRDVAAAKYSDWVRQRKKLEKFRHSTVTELLLSNDGDGVLEGCITNFFVVARKNNNGDDKKSASGSDNMHLYEVQTAPVSEGVLPGVIRQLVIEICLSQGITVQEIAPSWSKHESWEEAFVTSSLRLVQHVETIQAPSLWKSLESKSWKELSWEKKLLKKTAGPITKTIQREIMQIADHEAGLCSVEHRML